MATITKPASTWKSDAALLFCVLVWGVNFAILKAALAFMHPHVMNVFRLSISALVIGVIYAVQARRVGRPFWEPLRQHTRVIGGLGLLGYLGYQFFFIEGVDRTTAGSAGLIMASAPLWTALLGQVLGLEHLRRLAWLGLALSLVGTALIVAAGTQTITFGQDVFAGNLLMVGAAVLWGAYTALSRPVLSYVAPAALTFFGLLCALPFLYALGAAYWGTVAWGEVTAGVWLAILYSGGLSTGLTIVIWNWSVQTEGASQTAVYGNLVPFVAILSGVVLLSEPVTLLQLAGGALTVAGLVLMRRSRSEGRRSKR